MTSNKSKSADRENQIIDLIKKKGNVTIQELADVLSVSTMTVHRDLNRLEKAGQIRKWHGGASLAGDKLGEGACAMCGKSTQEKKVFIIYLSDGEQKITCCAHCGLMLLTVTKGAWQSMTMDYLHGHMISANKATYLIGCDLNVCCVPTILTFGSRQEAERFQTGFGGTLSSMDDAIQILMGTEHGTHHNQQKFDKRTP